MVLAFVASCLVQEATRGAETGNRLPRFVAVARVGQDAWLLTETGNEVFLQRGGTRPVRAFTFTSRGEAHRWALPPTSITNFRGEWWVANGSRTIETFDAGGRQRGVVVAPVKVTQVVATPGAVWVYDDLPAAVSDRLWFSRDGSTFKSVPMQFDESAPVLAKLLSAQLVLGGGPKDEILVAHMVGAPEVQVYGAGGRDRSFVVAYGRTPERDALRGYEHGKDLEKYSAPVRDILATADGFSLILRNREDVASRGVVNVEQGRRVDRYDMHGRQVATAILPERAKYILRGTDKTVTVLTDTGTVTQSSFGAPRSGGVVR